MTPRTFAALFLFGMVVAPSCSQEDPDDCSEGSQGCSCYGNGTCNQPLDCRGELCVDPGSGGSSSGSSGTSEPGGTDGGGYGGGSDAGEANGTAGEGSETAGTSGPGAGGAGGRGADEPACEPGETRCEQRSQETCEADGTWGAAEACPFACVAGECAGECVPQSSGCADELTPQRCDGEGRWEPLLECAGVCFGGACDCSAPTWFEAASDSARWRAELLDPRWSRGPVFALCENADFTTCPSAHDPPAFRAVLERGTLSVAFYNRADDDQAGDDAVFIGIASPGASSAVAAKISLDIVAEQVDVPPPVASDAEAPAPNSDSTVSWSSASDASDATHWSSPTPGIPDWVHSIASWRAPPDFPDGGWAITFKVDLTRLGYTVPTSTPVRLFVGTRFRESDGTLVSLPNITSDTVADSETIVPGNTESSGWVDFESPEPGCTGGLTLR